MKSRLSFLSGIFFPPRCCCCGDLVANRDLICENCRSNLPVIPLNCCKKCGQALEKCECARIPAIFSGIAVPFYNEGPAKAGVYALKMNGARENARFFGTEMARRFAALFPDVKPDFVTAVPMSRRRRRGAEYNHAGELAKVVADELNIEYRERILFKSDAAAPSQHTLNYLERIGNVKDIYGCKKDITGKTVLLVDDIRTTAATLNACARQLLIHGAKEVYCTAALLTERRG